MWIWTAQTHRTHSQHPQTITQHRRTCAMKSKVLRRSGKKHANKVVRNRESRRVGRPKCVMGTTKAAGKCGKVKRKEEAAAEVVDVYVKPTEEDGTENMECEIPAMQISREEELRNEYALHKQLMENVAHKEQARRESRQRQRTQNKLQRKLTKLQKQICSKPLQTACQRFHW
uniref:Uncharacterized protein n=1 Tax=Lygus hesperus TaxID=30085 RepID=A0A146KKM9_LYGHE